MAGKVVCILTVSAGLFKLDHNASLILTKQFQLPKPDHTLTIEIAIVIEMGAIKVQLLKRCSATRLTKR